MDQIDLLKKIPKEHYTLYEGKMIKIGDLLKLLLEEASKKAENKSTKKETK
jgi:hypothetical protein